MEAFIMTAEVGCVFWQLCKELKLDTEAKRVALLRILVKDHKAEYIRDPQTYLKDRRILAIRKSK